MSIDFQSTIESFELMEGGVSYTGLSDLLQDSQASSTTSDELAAWQWLTALLVEVPSVRRFQECLDEVEVYGLGEAQLQAKIVVLFALQHMARMGYSF